MHRFFTSSDIFAFVALFSVDHKNTCDAWIWLSVLFLCAQPPKSQVLHEKWPSLQLDKFDFHLWNSIPTNPFTSLRESAVVRRMIRDRFLLSCGFVAGSKLARRFHCAGAYHFYSWMSMEAGVESKSNRTALATSKAEMFRILNWGQIA